MSTVIPGVTAPQKEGHFAKVLTYRDLIVYGMVYVAPIGPWGTFAYVYDLSGGAAVLAYLIGVVCMYFTANSYKEICGEVSGPGSAYAYSRKAMGTGVGFLAGWMLLLDYLLVPALMYVFAAVALNTFVPSVSRGTWVLVCAGFSLGINWFGIAMTARVNLLFLLLQIVAVAVYVLWSVHALPGLSAALPLDAFWSKSTTPHGIFAATSICILAYLGFDAITTLTEEVKPEQRHLVGRSVVAVLLIVGAIVVVETWVMSGLARGFSFHDLASGVYDMTGAKVAPAAGIATAWIAAIVTGLSITPPMLAAVSRVLYAMSKGGQLPAFLGTLHPKYGVPQRCLLLSTLISVGVALSLMSVPDELTGIVNFGALTAYASVHLSVIVLLGVKRRSGRWIAHLLMPAIGIAIIAVVLTQMSASALMLGSAWFAVGLIYYTLLRKFRRGAAETDVPF